MATPQHVEAVLQGAEYWNKWRKSNPSVVPDLSGASLTKADLRDATLFCANFASANLSQADLSESCLVAADFYQSNLIGAKLVGCDLAGAHLSKAILDDADLTRARLIGANLNMARMWRANMSQCLVGWTLFARIDMRAVRGLEDVLHEGPSTIGIDTVYFSGGMFPIKFLRGAGVPDNFIEYMRSLVESAIEYDSCFISYSTQDQGFADKLYNDLQNAGVRCWFAPHDILAGRKLDKQIDDAIQMNDRLLLLLSKASMKSEWVKTEIASAGKRAKREKRPILFPLRLVDFKTLKRWKCFDADTGKDSAREIREFYVPDFSNWQDNASYRAEFERLVNSLKVGRKKPLPQ